MVEGTRDSRAGRSPIDAYPELIVDDHGPLLKRLIWVLAVGELAFMSLLLAAPDENWPRIVATLALLALGAVAWLVLRRHGAVPTIRLLATGGWIVATYAAFVGEGVRTPILLAYSVIVVFGGWMLGERYCLRLFAASAVAVLAMAAGQHAGVIGGAVPVPPASMAVAHLVVLGISALMTLYLLRLFRRRYAEERRLNQEIQHHLHAVQKRESDLRTLTEHIPDLVFEGDRIGRCQFANRRFAEFFGIASERLLGAHISGLIGDAAVRELVPYLRAALKGDVVEFVARRRDRQHQWHAFDVTLVPKHAADGRQVVGWYGLMHDVTKREATASELREQATHDPLTGLANRLFLDDRLAHAVDRARRANTRLAVLLIDLDHFKEVNDSQGHAAGDRLLREIARRIEGAVRAADTVARIGGDEFVVLIEGVASAEATRPVTAKILAELARPVALGEVEAQVGGSIGIAVYPDSGATAEALLQAADSAMYDAKAAGRNCWRVHRASLRAEAGDRTEASRAPSRQG